MAAERNSSTSRAHSGAKVSSFTHEDMAASVYDYFLLPLNATNDIYALNETGGVAQSSTANWTTASTYDYYTTDSDEGYAVQQEHSDIELYPVSTSMVALLSILYGLISVVAVIGNALVIIAILRHRNMQTVTNFFIANLSVADELIGIFSVPFQFQAALLQRWDLPAVMCPVAPFVKEVSVTVSVGALIVISVDRYIAILHPLRPRISGRAAAAVMTAVWLIAAVAALPSAIVYRVGYTPVTDNDSTSDGYSDSGADSNDAGLPELDNDGAELSAGRMKPFCNAPFPLIWNDVDSGAVYRLVLAVLQYFLPLGVISFTYIRIMHHVWLNKAPGSAVDTRDRVINRNKKKVIKMLTTVVVLFAICWLPLQTYNFTAEIFNEINEYRYINIIYLCCNWLAMSNSCYNPFVYGLLNDKFQHSFKLLFKSCVPPSCAVVDGRVVCHAPTTTTSGCNSHMTILTPIPGRHHVGPQAPATGIGLYPRASSSFCTINGPELAAGRGCVKLIQNGDEPTVNTEGVGTDKRRSVFSKERQSSRKIRCLDDDVAKNDGKLTVFHCGSGNAANVDTGSSASSPLFNQKWSPTADSL